MLTEEDIVNGAADGYRVIFVGLFGRFPRPDEAAWLSRSLSRYFNQTMKSAVPELAKFMKRFPKAAPEIAMQYMAAVRKASAKGHPLDRLRASEETLVDLFTTHMGNVAVGACASYMRQAGARHFGAISVPNILSAIHERLKGQNAFNPTPGLQ